MHSIAMAIDLDMCTGCFACQNACKMVNGLAPGTAWLKVLPRDPQPEEVHGSLYMDRFPHPATLHACLACPDRAAQAEAAHSTEAAEGGEPQAAPQLAGEPPAAQRSGGEPQAAPQPLCARSCMGEALFVGDPAAAEAWSAAKRTVTFKL